MKHTLKASAAILGIIAAVVILMQAIKLFACGMVYISEITDTPL